MLIYIYQLVHLNENMAAELAENIELNTICKQSEQYLCQPCSRKDKQAPPDVFCSTCDEFQCKQCSEIHSIYAYMKNHKIVSTKDLKSKPPQFDMKRIDRCDTHEKLFEFFCEDEDQVCCNTCAILYHRKCKSVVEIHTIVGKETPTSSRLKTKLQDVKVQNEKVAEHTETSKEQMRQSIKVISKKITKMQEDVYKMFEELKSSVIKDVEKFQLNTEVKLSQKKFRSEKHIEEASKYLETIDNVYKNGTPSQIFIVENVLKNGVEQLEAKVEDIETVTIEFDFDESFQLPPRSVSDYSPGKLTLKCQSQKSVKKSSNIQRTMKLEFVTSIDLKQCKNEAKEPLYSGLDFLPDGRLVAVDNYNKKCLVFNEKLEKVGSYQLSYPPQSVVVVSEEEVAITSAAAHKIIFLRISKSDYITLTKTCSVKSDLDSISMKDDGSFVVGTIDAFPPVRIVLTSGEEKECSIQFPDKKYPVCASSCKYIRNNNKLILTDRDDDTVYIYDIATNTFVVVKDAQIIKPCGIAIGPSNMVYVCSKGTNSIVEISPDGKTLTSHKLDMALPHKISISLNNSTLAVTNSCANRKKLQLFNLL